MDIMNLQNLGVNQTSTQAFAGKKNTSVRPTQQKTNSFASKLNKAVERSTNGVSGNDVTRPFANTEKPAKFNNESNINAEHSANGASGKEAAQPSGDMEKMEKFNNGNNIVNENQPKQTANDNQPDIPNAKDLIDGGQPLFDEKTEIADEFLSAAALMVQIPPVVNTIGEDTALQLSTRQDNFFLNFSERPGLSLTAEDVKGLSPDAKTLETIFSNENASDKGQVISQDAANRNLFAAKQDSETLTTKDELPKIAEDDAAKQPQTRPESANQTPGFAKHWAELVKPTTDANNAKPALEIAKLEVVNAAKPPFEFVKPNEQMIVTETTGLTLKESAAQNLANQQNTDGQQSFGQTTEFKAGTPQNPDHQPNNSSTFTVSFDAATQSAADKPGAAQTQQTASDLTTPRDEFQIKEQIIQHATLINRSAQESEMIIRLKPEHLGEIALKVVVNNGVVNASIHSNNAEVRGILENSIQQLKNDLANAGFKVDNVSISAGLSQFTADQERAMQWQQQQTRRGSGKKDGEGYIEAVENASANQQLINTSKDEGVDYRI